MFARMTTMAPPMESSANYSDLFAVERARLLDLLRTVRESEWMMPTPCPEWSVLGLCAHLVGDDFGVLSRGRDGHHGTSAPPGQSETEFIVWLDELQAQWVYAARRLSPRLVVDLLEWAGSQLVDMFARQDPTAPVASVSWAGSEPMPVWLNQARELSEYWIHRQQLLDALGRSNDLRPDLLAPVLDALRWAYPYRLAAVEGADGDAVSIEISGPVEVSWHLVRCEAIWDFEEIGRTGRATIRLSTEQAWRLLTNNLDSVERQNLRTSGDPKFVDAVLATRAIIGMPK
jgi:uncharacterized protein (TIGR03083 family)